MLEAALLTSGIIISLLSWYKAIPYGRFSGGSSYSIPNRWYMTLVNLPALVCLFLFVNIEQKHVLIFCMVHFFLRAIVVPLVIGNIYTSDSKRVSLIVVLLMAAYNGLVGYTLGYMCQHLEYGMETWLSWPLLLSAGMCLLLNVYYDIRLNHMRCYMEDIQIVDMYIKMESLCAEFPLLFAVGITSPNYFFEILEWLLIFILTWHTESFAYFIATWAILWVRGLSNDIFLSKV